MSQHKTIAEQTMPLKRTVGRQKGQVYFTDEEMKAALEDFCDFIGEKRYFTRQEYDSYMDNPTSGSIAKRFGWNNAQQMIGNEPKRIEKNLTKGQMLLRGCLLYKKLGPKIRLHDLDGISWTPSSWSLYKEFDDWKDYCDQTKRYMKKNLPTLYKKLFGASHHTAGVKKAIRKPYIPPIRRISIGWE